MISFNFFNVWNDGFFCDLSGQFFLNFLSEKIFHYPIFQTMEGNHRKASVWSENLESFFQSCCKICAFFVDCTAERLECIGDRVTPTPSLSYTFDKVKGGSGRFNFAPLH